MNSEFKKGMEIIKLQRENRELKVENERLKALLLRWNKSMSTLNLAGSEYIDDPERCVDRIKANTEAHAYIEVAKALKNICA